MDDDITKKEIDLLCCLFSNYQLWLKIVQTVLADGIICWQVIIDFLVFKLCYRRAQSVKHAREINLFETFI